MSYSQSIDKPAHDILATAAHAADGYFGWTDRYGIRPSFFPQSVASNPSYIVHR